MAKAASSTPGGFSGLYHGPAGVFVTSWFALDESGGRLHITPRGWRALLPCWARGVDVPLRPALGGAPPTLVLGCTTAGFARTWKYCTDSQRIDFHSRSFSVRSSGDDGACVDVTCESPSARDAAVSLLRAATGAGPAAANEPEWDERGLALGGPGLTGRVYRFINTKLMERLWFAAVLVDIVVLAMDEPQSAGGGALSSRLRGVATGCLAVFTLEMACRLVAREGLMGYLSDGWNQIDGLVVVSSWAAYGGGVQFGPLRLFRLLRVTRGLPELKVRVPCARIREHAAIS